jgi:tetratricopeptide (TPR) repeat protein
MARFLLLTCGALCVLFGCGEDKERNADALETLDRGWSAYARGDFSSALLEFERAANLDSTLADAHNGKGWTHLHLVEGAPSPQGLEQAVQAFARALRQDGQLADAWVGLGQALFLRKSTPQDLEDAARALASSRDANPGTLYRHDYSDAAHVLTLEGWCYYYAGNPDAARESARQALRLRPSLASARLLDDILR